jgi:hypothetical protein
VRRRRRGRVRGYGEGKRVKKGIYPKREKRIKKGS